MDTYPLTVGEIISWFRSKENALATLGIILAGVHERSGTDKPAAFADFDAALGMGRIIVWVSGDGPRSASNIGWEKCSRSSRKSLEP